MSCIMQDSINQDLSWNITKAMATSIDSSIPFFLGNDYNAHLAQVLEGGNI